MILRILRWLYASFYLLIGIQTALALLGMVLLTPFVVGIFFTHLLLDGSVIWGTAHLALLVLLAWQFRSAYRPLWTHTDARARDKQ